MATIRDGAVDALKQGRIVERDGRYSESSSGCSRGAAFLSWASRRQQKCVGLRHARDPQPAATPPRAPH